MNAIKLDKSGGDCSEKKLYRLVAVKLQKFTAKVSGEITQVHHLESAPNFFVQQR